MLKTGTIVDGKYKILSEIGHGGMSTVYLAINERVNKSWAIKEIRKKNNRHFETLRQSLIAETNLLKRLSHPSLPRIIDVIENDGDFLIVMDYIDGHTLEKLINDEGAQPQDKVVEWALQLCDVLEYLHSQPVPVIYRDMKPSNIMLKSDGRIMLIDFGTAREYKNKSASDTSYLGTKGYAAPEQFGGMGQTDARTDIYCLGATMYHLLTAHNPSEPPYETYPITKWKPELSDGLEKIVSKCMRKNPNDRYQSVNELAYALKHYSSFETHAQGNFKKRLAIFLTTSAMAVLCFVMAVGFKTAGVLKLNREYDELLERGCHIEAIKLAPNRPQAYHGFCDAAVADEAFTEEEERKLLDINTSAGKYLEVFAKDNPLEYADFCYEIGSMYQHYSGLGDGEGKKTDAIPWFKTALDYYGDDKSYAIECDKCLAYIEAGMFSQKAAALQIEGSDEEMYKRYWECLVNIRELDSQKPTSSFVTIDIDRELVSEVIEYAGYFKSDGVAEDEILLVLDKIEKRLSDIDDSDEKRQKNIGDIKNKLNIARREIAACYLIK